MSTQDQYTKNHEETSKQSSQVVKYGEYEVGGSIMGMPYDFRRPTLERMKERVWNPKGSMLMPKVWGCGWTLNLAHRGSWLLLFAVTTLIVLLSQFG